MSTRAGVLLRRADHASLVASAEEVARAVGLSPRPEPAVTGMVLVCGGGLPDADPGLGAAWGEALSALRRAQRSRWTLERAGSSGEGVLLDVVDAGAAGLWVVGSAAELDGWRPVTATTLWELLAGLLDAAA